MLKNLELINLGKMEEIYIANHVEMIMRENMLYHMSKRKKLQNNSKKEKNGKDSIVKTKGHLMQKNVEHGIKEIWNEPANYHWKQLKDTIQLRKVGKKETKERIIGRKKILKKEELKRNYNIGSKQEKFKNHLIVLSAILNARYKHIILIILNLWKYFGFVRDVIFFYIMNINITVNDLTKKLLKEMRKSQLPTKAEEGSPKWEPRQFYNWSVNHAG